MAKQANPASAVGAILVPLLVFVHAVTWGPIQHRVSVHVMAGVRWTIIDVFSGLVLGRVITGHSDDEEAHVFDRLTPTAGFLFPVLALTTFSG